MAGVDVKNFDNPDEITDFGDQGKSNRLTIGMEHFGVGNESTVWRSILEPGWSWMRNIKPDVPFESCPLHHREYVVSGHIRYAMSDGTEVIGGPGDLLLIEPGHLAEVVGDVPCVLIDW